MKDRPITPERILSPIWALALVTALGACNNKPDDGKSLAEFKTLQAIAETSNTP